MNSAPYLEEEPESPKLPIPCLNSTVLKDWHHTFEKAIDPDDDAIMQIITCELLSFDFFFATVLDSKLTIKVNPKPKIEPSPGIHDC